MIFHRPGILIRSPAGAVMHTMSRRQLEKALAAGWRIVVPEGEEKQNALLFTPPPAASKPAASKKKRRRSNTQEASD